MGTSATRGVLSMTTIKPLLKAQMAHSITIPARALITANAEDRVVLGCLIGLGLNVATLPQESLQQLQNSATMELLTRAGHAKQILQEQKINIEQLCLQWDEAVTQKQQVEQLVAEAYANAPKLEIRVELPIKT